MATFSKFPLLRLPIIALNKCLQLLNPFEVIAMSMCSKSMKMLCKESRSKKQWNSRISSFQLRFSFNLEISFYFHGYRSTWTIRFPKSNLSWIFNRLSYFIGSSWFAIGKNSLRLSSWEPTEISNTFNFFGTRIPTHQYHLSAEHREISIFHEWVMHLSELFKVSLKDIMLEFQHFDQQTTDLITELFIFQNNNSRLNTCFLENNKLLGRMEENLITSILNRQNAQKTLKLDFEFSPQFGFNIINLKNHPKYLIITHSHWVDINIVFEMRCSFIRLQKSNFSKDQCKMLIEKWKEGWTPKWSTLQIEYSESLDVDYCVNEPNAEIKPTEQHDADAELLISWYRIRAEEQIHDFELYETRCHIIRRSDECILTFSTKFENYGRMKIVSKSDEVSHDRVYSKYFI